MTLTNHQEASLIKAYYTDGYAIGRDKICFRRHAQKIVVKRAFTNRFRE